VAKLSKDTVVADVASSAGVSKTDAEAVLTAFFDKAAAAMRNGDEVTWPKFGKFSQGHRAARTGRNPQTGATIDIPASNHPKFTAAAALKDTVKG
jgi:DNA-binding protein HU-beta